MKHLIDEVLCELEFKNRCLMQSRKMNRLSIRLQRYEQKFQLSSCKPISLLLFLKKYSQIINEAGFKFTLHSGYTPTERFKTKDLTEVLSHIKIKERGKRSVENKRLLSMISTPVLHRYLTAPGVGQCAHISCITSDQIWVAGDRNVILTNQDGTVLHDLKDLYSFPVFGGLLTVNSQHETLYIDSGYNIVKLSWDFRNTSIFIKSTVPTCRPRCLYCSPSSGDLLVGMYVSSLAACKVNRYDFFGELIQTIQYNKTGYHLYKDSFYITENNNGDVVVSDAGHDAIVVTDRGGRHRFSYTGHPSFAGPCHLGICTDALSNILVCDVYTQSIQIIDKDGQFLSHLLIRPPGIMSPSCIYYDVVTHLLWVGSSQSNTVFAYRYINRRETLTGKSA